MNRPNTPDSGDLDAGSAAGADDAQSLARVDAGIPNQGHADAGPADAGEADAARLATHGRSRGCGITHTGDSVFDAFGTEAGNVARAYYFYMPKSYDPSVAYALIFRFHGYGGSGVSGGLEIDQDSDGGALIVSPNGLLDGMNKLTWDPANEELDVALFDKLLGWVAENYCVDLDRVFAYGFSAGGGMAQLLACKRAESVRAVGTIAAVNRTMGLTCGGKTAAFLSYDQNDPAVPLTVGVAVRDQLLLRNRCTTQSMASGTNCVRYSGCSEGEPVVWCVSHSASAMAHDPGGAAGAKPIWQFFSGLPPRASGPVAQ